MTRPKQTLLERFDSIPPMIVFRMAKAGRRRHVAYDQIVEASGLPATTFCRIAKKSSWASIKLGKIDAFCRACGVDFLRICTKRRFLTRTIQGKRPFSHLTKRQLKKLNAQVKAWKENGQSAQAK